MIHVWTRLLGSIKTSYARPIIGALGLFTEHCPDSRVTRLSIDWNCPGKWCQRLWNVQGHWSWSLSITWILFRQLTRGLDRKDLISRCLVLSINWNCPHRLWAYFWGSTYWNCSDTLFRRLFISQNCPNNSCYVILNNYKRPNKGFWRMCNHRICLNNGCLMFV